MDGVLLINKPGGCTSHDVCLNVKRKLKAAKIGHTGTLDPMATGVLPLCINGGTKLVQFLLHGEKEYAGSMRFGLETDTQDIEGAVLATSDRAPADLDEIVRASRELTGAILQLPPMYSALKQDGVPLYRLARQGKTVDRIPRRVLVSAFEIITYEPPEAFFRVICSQGTYVRTLCRDIGSLLGCGAVLSSLERVRTGGFHVRDALPLDAIRAMEPEDIYRDHVIAMDDALGVLPEVVVDDTTAARLRNGLSIADEMQRLGIPEMSGDRFLKIRQHGGGVVGVVQSIFESGIAGQGAESWKTVRVFAR